MATKEIRVDDLDGSENAERLEFAFAGVSYEIDLNAAHRAQFEKAMQPWLEAATRTGGRRGAKRTPSASGADDIREWARDNGYEVKARGRVSAELRAAYEAAQRA